MLTIGKEVVVGFGGWEAAEEVERFLAPVVEASRDVEVHPG